MSEIGDRPELPPDNYDHGKSRQKRQLVPNIRLYNLADDPTETFNVAEENEEIVVNLLQR